MIIAYLDPWGLRFSRGFLLLEGRGSYQVGSTVSPKKLETGLRPNSAGIPFTWLLRIQAIGFPTFGLLL